jgi:hypothetical protein
MFVRFARSCAAFSGVLVLSATAPAWGQESAAPQTLGEAVRVSLAEMVLPPPPAQQAETVPSPPPPRPVMLAPLYTSYVALQALDIHSTRRALSKGGVEANPLMKGVTGNAGLLIALKCAATAGTILGAERLSKKHRLASVLLMVGANSAMAYVVSHNYRVVR